VAASVTDVAAKAGISLDHAHKLGAIASALPAFWEDYRVGVGATAGMNAASAVKEGIVSRLKAAVDREALAQQETQRQTAQAEEQTAAEEQAAKAEKLAQEKAKTQRFKQQRRQAVEQAQAYDFVGLPSAVDEAPSLLGSIHTDEVVSHLESQARSAHTNAVMEGMKELEQESFRPRHRRSYSQEFLSLNAAVHMQANHAWQGLAAYERDGIERVSAFQAMANFGAEAPMPLFTKAPQYLSEADAGRAFVSGLRQGHHDMAEHGLAGMGEAAYLGVDFCIPGGIDFGLAYAKGEITRSQFLAYQTAAIAAEAATGYAFGKAVKGVAKTTQRMARLASEFRVTQRVKRATSAPLVVGHRLSDVINRHPKTGRIRSVEGAQVHHIVSDKNPLTTRHPLWDLAGMNPNDSMNKMLLPTKKGAEEMWTGTTRSIHEGRHLKDVSVHLEKKMDTAQRKGYLSGGTQEQYATELRKIILEERKVLSTGERMLNKHHQPNAVPLAKTGE
jgi:hypothetical protein